MRESRNTTGQAKAVAFTPEERRGVAAGVLCYMLWGLFPIYWKLLAEVNSFEIIAHRIIWCFVTTALVCAVVLAHVTGSHAFAVGLDTAHGWYLTALLVIGGPVTAIPLILFAKAANSIPLSLLGFIQYLSPTIALLSGVFLFGEAFTLAHAVCFGSIWCGLALVSFEAVRASRVQAVSKR